MSRGPACLLAMCCLLALAAPIRCGSPLGPTNKKNLTVGYLTAIKGDLKDRQGLAVSGALSMALQEVNNDRHLLPWVHLNLRWNDTRGETVATTRSIVDMLCDGVAAFFGPEGSCHVEAIVAQSRNVPMISYKCSDYKASEIPTFARTEPPDTQVTKSVISLLRYYHWTKFTVLFEQEWKSVAASLESQAKEQNMTVVSQELEDKHKCCVGSLDCCHSSYYYNVVKDTRNRTRIYVFLGTPMSLIDMMSTMQSFQLFDEGEYMVIYVDMMTYSPKEAQKYLWKPEDYSKIQNCDQLDDFKKKAQSLLVVVSTPPAQNYENFTEKVRNYNKKDPFNFKTPELFLQSQYHTFVSIYAAYLYDSVKLYARALDQLLREHGEPLTEEDVDRIASNGTRIIETIINNHTYQSITGATIKLDHYGDSEGNFSVLAFKPYNLTITNFTCDYHMVPVGLFLQGKSPEYKLNSATVQIEWPGGRKPECEPNCGFFNELCPKDASHEIGVIVAAALGVVLFCALVIALSIYRKWKIEQEIEGLLWKINPEEIRDYYKGELPSAQSKSSIGSATSFESRNGQQVFAQVAQYRSVRVRIKELKFSKKKDISREIMKEMRVLRDIRHDNITSFVGAVIEPMKILILSDYCAKGSLYDIIENEDIKLDEMFIASLIHDLIKAMVFVHNSLLVFHGNLKSSNCVVTSRWVLQVTDFGLHELRHCAENGSIGDHQYFSNQFWKAPELLRDTEKPVHGTPKGDVYAFAIILYEIIGRHGPFGNIKDIEPKEIIKLVKSPPPEGPFRPDVELLRESPTGCPDYVINVIQDCWTESPEGRPDFPTIRQRLKRMKTGGHRNIVDQMMKLMEKYANNLEELVNERTRLLFEEKQKTESLLHRMLPQPVAEKLTSGQGVEPESYDSVTIYFSDIVGFTAMSAESTPLEVVNFLNDLYTQFDRIIKGYHVYKVETIGDAYMVVSGLPIKNGDQHAGEVASMALDLLNAVKHRKFGHRQDELKLRIGIHTGPVVAGVVGLTMPRYCLFGDTVNTASRMESNGEALRIHISTQCKMALDKIGGYITEKRGFVHMKGKGEVLTYWLVGATDQAVKRRPVDTEGETPLFCLPPRGSPKLGDSRQPSILAFNYLGYGPGSRRHSTVPRGNSIDVGSTSTLGVSGGIGQDGPRHSMSNGSNHSPASSSFKKNRLLQFIRNESKSKLSQQPFREQSADSGSSEPKAVAPPVRHRRVLSSVASSSATGGYASDGSGPVNDADVDKLTSSPAGRPTGIRLTRSLEFFPLSSASTSASASTGAAPPQMHQGMRLNTQSLENWQGYARRRPVSVTDVPATMKKNNYSFPNGDAIRLATCSGSANAGASSEDVRVPLLPAKKWRSLQQLSAAHPPAVTAESKKGPTRGSIRSWLVGLFNVNGLRASETSLRRSVHSGYSDLPVEKERESIV